MRSVGFGIAFGLLVFLADASLTLAQGGSLPLPSAVPVLVIVALLASGASVARRLAPARYTPLSAAVALAAYAAVLGVVAARRSGADLGIAAALLGTAAWVAWWIRDGRPRGPRGAVIVWVVMGVVWLLRGPEAILLPEPYRYWCAAVFLVLWLTVALELWRWSAAPIVAWALVPVLATCVWAVHAAGSPSLRPAAGRDGRPAASPTRPNVLLIVWDTVRRDHLSVYGYERPTTPYLESRRAESVTYTDAVTVAPWTLPAHASLFTGLYPRAHGAHFVPTTGARDYRGLPEGARTLAEILTDDGYVCGAVSANYFYVTRRLGLDQGFEFFHSEMNPRYLLAGRLVLRGPWLRAIIPWLPPAARRSFVSHAPAEVVTRNALDWLDSLPGDRPFFLFLNFMDAHQPTHPPGDLVDRFPGYAADLVEQDVWTDMLAEDRAITPRERAHRVSQYDAQLVHLDRQLAAFEATLRARGLFDETLVVLTSDHGEFFGEHGLVGHERDVYEEVLRVPLLIHHPKARTTGQSDDRFEIRRLFHLILAEVGVATPEPRYPWDAAAELHPKKPPSTADGGRTAVFRRLRRALSFGALKHIESSDGGNELYDLSADPGEDVNLVESRADEAARGRALNAEFLRLVPESDTADTPGNVSEREREQLRALGYVQ